MKTNKAAYVSAVLLLAFFLAGQFFGCGSANRENSGGDGSGSTTVGGASTKGSSVQVDITTNRSSMRVGDQALLTVKVSCSAAVGNCIRNSAGNLVFAALPTEFQTGNDAPQASLEIIANFGATSEGTLSKSTDKVTLAAGTRANSTASPATSVIPGVTATSAVFAVTLTAAKEGTAVFTAQSSDTVANIAIQVVRAVTSAITGS